jgi:dTDP-4-dehydrorhamnose 3,5-epimerase
MRVVATELPEVLVIEPEMFRDSRGFFFESYNEEKYRPGIAATFVQDNHSGSRYGTVRGLHAQLRNPQGKLVRVLAGEIWDVAVDIRPLSATYRQWVGVVLSAMNRKQIWVPPGFAHGFCALSEFAEVEYKVTAPRDAESELTIAWNDPALAIAWPLEGSPVLSDKDRDAPTLAEVEPQLLGPPA